MLEHYKGELGEFWYDEDEYELVKTDICECLHYKGTNPINLKLPEGCINTYGMFKDCVFEEGSSFKEFNTSNVKYMGYMFEGCVFPKGFSLGDGFDTSNVTEMQWMFGKCEFPEEFSLGNSFDTSKVTDFSCMFCYTKFSEGFDFGSKFSTESAIYMINMFATCKFSKDFQMGIKFDFRSLKEAHKMFKDAKMYAGFVLGDEFLYLDTFFDDYKLEEIFYPFTIIWEGKVKICYAKSVKSALNMLKSYAQEKEERGERDGKALCVKDLIELMKDNKDLKIEELAPMLKSYGYIEDLVNFSVKEVKNRIKKSCLATIPTMYKMVDSYSNISVGELKERLIQKGYQEEIVTWCIVEYLRDQYLSI